MTVGRWRHAQDQPATGQGMPTGPVTILDRPFGRDDQSLRRRNGPASLDRADACFWLCAAAVADAT